MPVFEVSAALPSDDHAPQLADLRRYGRFVVRRFVSKARAVDQPTFRSLISAHLGVETHDLPVVAEQWPAYEHVNVQGALDVVLSEHGDGAQVIGVAGHRHHGPFGIADLLGEDPRYSMHGPRPGNVTRTSLPSGPRGETRECLRVAVVLVTDGDDRTALLFCAPDPESGSMAVSVEIISTRPAAAEQLARRLRELALELNVYRGQVVSFGRSMFGERGSLLRIRERPTMAADELILPDTTFEDLRRQVVGVARNSARLRAAGQHLKRGLLLYGPPGVGKTHSVRYLISELVGTTVVELTGETLHGIREACSVARSLQPSMIVVEDVDLIAEERSHHGGETPLLFTLLNEMDGLDDDSDVVFLLTTNRADLLEPALAARPGRVDQAVHIDVPDRDSRRRLIELYRGSLEIDLGRLETVLDRTDGVTASFLKELLRRAAVVASDRDQQAEGVPLRATADDLDSALDDLLDTRNQMTRAVLGFRNETPAVD
ncbi:ATP-binding protein [Nocardioides bizhenqiangii]|uniref:ATP-binding protein n=1 Tax=Nocardioides bizhenqiangii TaxID=3095076 RepID=A0ABZ0ZJQ1_9ACTN|nr:ATP-binding protein [Nocardioides sp. HM61]WQQ24635.1 ATP-binding protein [Nocardioides sp. HM61]